MMNKIFAIFEGWYKAMHGIKTTQSEERMAICKECPEAVSRKVLVILNGKDKFEDSLQCTVCKCPCLQKSLVNAEKCPLGKW